MPESAGGRPPTDRTDRSATCAACGGGPLCLRFRPRRTSAGELIPSTSEFGHALADIVRCARCGHMQLAAFPSERELRAAYADAESTDYVAEEPGQLASAAANLRRIERHQPPGDLLDLGCWVGYFAYEAARRGWRPVGVEPSEFASRFARDRLRLDVRTEGLFEADLPEAGFDAVFMGDVVEHIPDAAGVLDRVAGLLRPAGVLAMALPDAGSLVARTLGRRWWSVIPTHVHYFTRSSMNALLRRRGWKVIEIDTAPKTFTVRYYLERLGGYSGPVAEILVRLATRAGMADRLWTPDFGDRMLVIARREGAG